MFTISENMRTPDTWFLLLISAIWAQLRLVGDSTGFADMKTVVIFKDRWRMPTMDELEGLYQKGKGTRNMCPLLKTTGWWVWSGEIKDSSSAWYFYFFGDGRKGWYDHDHSSYGRAFAVRSRK